VALPAAVLWTAAGTLAIRYQWLKQDQGGHKALAVLGTQTESLMPHDAGQVPSAALTGNGIVESAAAKSETESERQSKHELAVFAAERIIPACKAQQTLHKAIIHRLCGNMQVIEHLAEKGLNIDANVQDYTVAGKALFEAVENNVRNISFQELMNNINIMSNLYHACSFFEWLCHGSNIDFRNDPELSEKYLSWRSLTDDLQAEYQRFSRDPRFSVLYELDTRQVLGKGFVTNY